MASEELALEPLAFGIVLILEARLRKAGLKATEEVKVMRQIGEAFHARAKAPHCADCNRVSDVMGEEGRPMCAFCLKPAEITS